MELTPTKNKQIYNSACKKLIFFVLFMYGMMMGSKNIFTAEIIVIQEFFSAGSAETNLANTFYYIFYGLLQCFLVLFIDRINLRNYLGLTVLFSALFTTFMGVIGVATKNLISVYILFSLNGLCQAGLYASSMKIFSKNLPKSMLPRTNKLMSSVAIIANALSYGISAPFAESLKWEFPFLIAGVVFILSVVLFYTMYPKIIKLIKENEVEEEIIFEQSLEQKSTSDSVIIRNSKDIIFFYILLCLMSFISNSLYFAVNTWFSKLLKDVFGMPKNYSIIISLFVPLIIFIGSVIAVNQCEKHRNIFKVALVLYSISLIFSFLLIFLYNCNIVLSIFLEICYLIIVNGARGIFGSIFVFKMRTVLDSGKTGLITNAVASFAAGIAPTFLSLIFDNFGWTKSYLVLFIMDVILILTILFTILNEKRKSKSNVQPVKFNLE